MAQYTSTAVGAEDIVSYFISLLIIIIIIIIIILFEIDNFDVFWQFQLIIVLVSSLLF